ncbi:hypothetical protein ACFSR7_36335 [Cohnella sp. GCM10020058]|uniref:hypothetical protein n=1 Tax=Cohnella sp. GCM10020058 TaxID=3317330 RepID=UPI003637A0C8
MSNLKSMVRLDTVGSIGKKPSGQQVYQQIDVYEAGMVDVLTQVAMGQLLSYEYQGPNREVQAAEEKKVEAMHKAIVADFPELESRLDDLISQITFASAAGEGAAYIDGFIAGYRFLKLLYPS